MYYFVIGVDNRRYGPADVDTLVDWAREGRIIGSTVLIERGTEQELCADGLPALAAIFRHTGGAGVSVERDADRDEPEREPCGTPRHENGVEPGLQFARSVDPDATQGAGAPPYAKGIGPKSKVVAGLLGVFLGGLGLHRFYLGYWGVGLLMLFLNFIGSAATFTCVPGLGCGIVWLWGFVEGIICFCGGMSDAEGRTLRD